MNSKIAKQAKQIIDSQVQKGIDKYGHTLDDNNAPLVERIDHFCEEMADGLQYAIWIKQQIKTNEFNAYVLALGDLMEKFNDRDTITRQELFRECIRLTAEKNKQSCSNN